MDSLRAALTSVKDLLDWLPDPVVALLILAIAVLFALALHRWARKLIRRAFGERYPYVFSVFTQTRGLTRLALLILAMIVAIPVAPLPPDTAAVLARARRVAIGTPGSATLPPGYPDRANWSKPAMARPSNPTTTAPRPIVMARSALSLIIRPRSP